LDYLADVQNGSRPFCLVTLFFAVDRIYGINKEQL
jgi:hypothetical protein